MTDDKRCPICGGSGTITETVQRHNGAGQEGMTIHERCYSCRPHPSELQGPPTWPQMIEQMDR